MIVESSRTRADVQGLMETHRFSMEASEESFAILSDGLYANKIRAVIRELVCNAHDSHVDAGKGDVPVQVHLPTALEPWFSVKDQGTGISPEDVKTVLTVYFKTTKDKTNAQTGCLGLGCKSPYAVSDTFTVTSVYAGVRTEYSAFIGDTGVPDMATLASVKTDEPNGVTFTVPVNNEGDFREYRNEARRIFQWFAVAPVDSEGNVHEVAETEYKQKDIVPGVNLRGGYGNPALIMGNIEYPINTASLFPNDKDLENYLDNNSFEFNVPIGFCKFQPSREGLGYNRRTRVKIKRLLLKTMRAIRHQITADVMDCSDHWERADYVIREYQKTVSRSVTKSLVKRSPELFPSLELVGGHLRIRTVQVTTEDLEKWNIRLRGFVLRNRSGSVVASGVRSAHHGGYNIFMDDRSLFYVNDTEKGAWEKTKRHAKHHGKVSGSREYMNDHRYFLLEKADSNKDWNTQAFFDHVLSPKKVEYVSKITVPPRQAPQKKAVPRTVPCFTVNFSFYSNYTWDWADYEALSKDTVNTRYYLPVSGYDLDSPHGDADVRRLAYSIRTLLGLGNIRVYGATKTVRKDVGRMNNWVNLEELLLEKIQSGDADIMKCMEFSYPIGDFVDKLDPDHDLVTVKSVARRCWKEFPADLLERYSGVSQVQEAIDLYKWAKEVVDRYPLIKHTSSGAPADHLAVYIQAIDQEEKANVSLYYAG